ncbi:hypothetical protein ES703_32028 [subsurface metagenome]
MALRLTFFRAFALTTLLLSSNVNVTAVMAGQLDPSGIWLTQAGDAKVGVSRCGAGICGRIVWLKVPIDPTTGRAQVDDKNPNPSLAKRRIIGLQILIGMKPQSDNSWSGLIYNADDGKTYTSNISLPSMTSLKVGGCAGVLCGNEIWSKASGR